MPQPDFSLRPADTLEPFFSPRVVAVVGASRERNKIGTEILHNLIDTKFTGTVIPVHPTAAETSGLPAYRASTDIPIRSTSPSSSCLPPTSRPSIDECLAKGVKAICIISAGFGECSDEGRQREQAIVAKARRAGCRMIGPNCMGLLNTDPEVRLNATFSPVYPPAGQRRDVDAKRRARSRDSRLRAQAEHRHLELRVGRQQGRRLRQRSARVLGGRSAHVGDPALPRELRQSGEVQPHRAPHQPHQADRRAEVRPIGGRRPRRGVAHRRARRRPTRSSMRCFTSRVSSAPTR